ncbi:MAG: iron-sulfur cluster assembly accessory protein [Pirellulaceae bacterium]
MAVLLSEKAADEVKRILVDQKHEGSTMLRIGISAGGCSGFSYSLTLTQDIDDEKDNVYDYHGVQVVVDKKSALYLDGTTVDFHEGIDRRGFAFNNPHAVKSCGCGQSFQA